MKGLGDVGAEKDHVDDLATTHLRSTEVAPVASNLASCLKPSSESATNPLVKGRSRSQKTAAAEPKKELPEKARRQQGVRAQTGITAGCAAEDVEAGGVKEEPLDVAGGEAWTTTEMFKERIPYPLGECHNLLNVTLDAHAPRGL